MDIGPTAVQEQAEFDAVTADGPGLVAVGSIGGPDDVPPHVTRSARSGTDAFPMLVLVQSCLWHDHRPTGHSG